MRSMYRRAHRIPCRICRGSSLKLSSIVLESPNSTCVLNPAISINLSLVRVLVRGFLEPDLCYVCMVCHRGPSWGHFFFLLELMILLLEFNIKYVCWRTIVYRIAECLVKQIPHSLRVAFDVLRHGIRIIGCP